MATSSAAIRGSCAAPMSTTSVSSAVGPPQSTSAPSRLGRILVAGDHGEDGGEPPVRDRNAGVGGRGDRGDDAGHDLDGDAGLPPGQDFLVAPAEHERIAALEANDERARPHAHEQR